MGLVFPPLALHTLAASPALMALPAPLTFKGRAPSSISHITQLPLVGLASISLSESSAFYTCGVKDTAPAQGSGQALGGTCDAHPHHHRHTHIHSKPNGPLQRALDPTPFSILMAIPGGQVPASRASEEQSKRSSAVQSRALLSNVWDSVTWKPPVTTQK